MKRTLRLIAAAGAGVLVSNAPSLAVNQGISAVKLIIVDKGANGAKAVFVAKDPAVDKGAGTNTATIGVTLGVHYDNGVDTSTSGAFLAPAGSPNWTVNKPTVAKYVNKAAPAGGATKVAVVKPAILVKLVGKNLGDTPINILAQSGADSGTAHTSYRVTDSSTSFDTSFCSTFSGCDWKSIAGGTGAKLVCKPGVADPTCGGPPPPPLVVQGALPPSSGLFNYSGLGLTGANSACSAAFASTHACTYSELMSAPTSDLAGLKDTNNTPVTSFWQIEAALGAALQCNDTLGSLQDWEYQTAHTGVFAQTVPLNNDGTLSPPGGALCAGSSWVGCCL